MLFGIDERIKGSATGLKEMPVWFEV